jgi:O-antigen/teichoic acid export membrane protein
MSLFLALNVALALLLLPSMGALGAAVATAVATIGWNVAAAVFVYRRFGINCFAIQPLPRAGGGDDGQAR